METTEILEIGIYIIGALTGTSFLATPKVAKAINLGRWLVKGGKAIFDKADAAMTRIEDSKAGFSPELAKEELKKTAKELVIENLNKVVDPKNTAEMITEQDFKKISEIVSKSKGMVGTASKVLKFVKAL